jgi:hypothetical protein
LHLLNSLIVLSTPYSVFNLRFVAVFEELGKTGPVEDGESRPKMNLEPIRRIGDFRPANYTFHVDQLLSRPVCRQARALHFSSRHKFFRIPLSTNNGEGRADFSMRSAQRCSCDEDSESPGEAGRRMCQWSERHRQFLITASFLVRD